MSEAKIDFTRIYDKAALINHLAEENDVEYLFFWGHTAKEKSMIAKECLSQWYKADFVIDGITYPSAEHFMMAEKARLFNDEEILDKILQTSDPYEAKKLGRVVKDYDNDVWNQCRFDIVVKANKEKFMQNEKLKQYLLSTDTKIIVEASPRDRIWGIGMGQNNPEAKNPFKWRGLNLLGFALMVVRDKLQE